MNRDELKNFKNITESYWIDSTSNTNYSKLDKDINVDMAIVGGGMVGITTAYQLQKQGLKIAILEGNRIAQGTTGKTTGKITSQHHLIYTKLIKQFGKDLALQYAKANEFAIGEIRKIADENNIDCDYSLQESFIYTQDETYVKEIEDEVESAKKLGIEASFVEQMPISFPIKAGIRFDNQAQFHSRKFLLPLAEIVHKNGGQIYEESRIVELDENKEGKYVLTSSSGHKVRANKVIIASHYPFYNKLGLYYARVSQWRTYAIVIKAKEKFPGGMYINAEEPNRSLRSLSTDSGEYILVVGNNHRTGQGDDTNKHYGSLIDFASDLFTIEEIPYRWSTQDCKTVDGVPYIGNLTDETPNLYVATGFNKWGISNSIVSSILLTDLITKGSSPWEKIYNPSRNKILPAAKEFTKQTVNVAANLVGGKIEMAHKDTDVEKGQGKIIKHDGKKVGAYRDEDGKLHLVNIICTHMGCNINWNPAERSWDCPCHGSRYDIYGNILDGPAVHPLSFDNDVNIITKLIKEDF